MDLKFKASAVIIKLKYIVFWLFLCSIIIHNDINCIKAEDYDFELKNIDISQIDSKGYQFSNYLICGANSFSTYMSLDANEEGKIYLSNNGNYDVKVSIDEYGPIVIKAHTSEGIHFQNSSNTIKYYHIDFHCAEVNLSCILSMATWI